MTTLLIQAERAADDFSADAAKSNEIGQLTDHAWDLLHEVGILRALQPARFGGGEVPLVDFIDAVVAISAAAPAAGWVAGVIGVHPWQLALFDEQAQQEMWADDGSRMHSSSYNPTGTAIKVEGGYEVSGRWSFSSGCDHCVGVNLGAVIRTEAKGMPDYRSFLLYSDQYRIDDTWDVVGLKGTGSKDIVVDTAFVPEHRTQSHVDYASSAPLPGWDSNPGSLYRIPWSVVFNMALAASTLGSAQGYLDVWRSENADRKISGGATLADDPITQRRLAEAHWALDASITLMRANAIELQDRASADDTPTMAGRGRYRWNLNRGCELVSDAVSQLHRAASGRTIFRDHPLHRRFQDFQAGLGHVFLVPDPLAKSVGGDLLGTTNPEMLL